MASNIFSQENDALFFNPNLCAHATSAEDEDKKKQRRGKKKNKGSCSDWRKRNLTAEQVNCLEHNFSVDHTLETQRKEKLASELNLDPQQVAVWFQNRRVRWRVKNLEQEHIKLQTAHEGILVEKSHLEEEVLRLKAQLTEKKNRLQMLAESSDGISCYNQDLAFSLDMDLTFLGDFGMEGLGNPFPYYENKMDWVNCV